MLRCAGMLFHFMHVCINVFGSSGEQLPLDPVAHAELQSPAPLFVKGFITSSVRPSPLTVRTERKL